MQSTPLIVQSPDGGRCAMLRFSVKAEWNVAADVWKIAYCDTNVDLIQFNICKQIHI